VVVRVSTCWAGFLVTSSAALRLSFLLSTMFPYRPKLLGRSSTDERANANPAPSFVWIFDKFAHHQRSQHSAKSYKVGAGIAGGIGG
jgi:hypothetical protein